MLLHGFYEVGCLYKAFVCTGIQPCEALAQKLNVQLSLLKVDTVQVCDLKLASCAWLQIFCVLYNLVVVEVETGYTVVAFGLFRFLFNGNRFSVLVEFHDAETLRIIYIVSENSGTFACFCIVYSSFQALFEAMSCENVVTKDHTYGVVADEFLADDKCLSKSVRAWLYSIGKVDTELMAVTEKLLKSRGILRGGDDQDITDACVHKNRHRIVDHRFVKDRQKLFGGHHGKRVKTCSGASG